MRRQLYALIPILLVWSACGGTAGAPAEGSATDTPAGPSGSSSASPAGGHGSSAEQAALSPPGGMFSSGQVAPPGSVEVGVVRPASGVVKQASADPCQGHLAVGPSPLRRMTHAEYDHAVQALLGTELSFSAHFPEDLPQGGFASNRGDPLAELGAEKLMLAAESVAAEAVTRLGGLVDCPEESRDAACARDFFASFARRAYRRSPSLEELEELDRLYAWGEAEDGFALGIQVGIERVLQSPYFTYRLEHTVDDAPVSRLTALSVADRLAALLWQGIPDEPLLAAAESGQLQELAGITEQAQRMLADDRGRDGVVEFFNQWLDIEKLQNTEKSAMLHPEFTPELREAMWAETTGFADFVVRQGDGSLSTLLRSDLALPQGPLAEFYGVEPSESPVPIDSTVRSGLLTHPSLLAVHAHADQTSPAKRGNFIRTRLMCAPAPPPPPAVDATPPVIDPNATTRERFEQHRQDAACAACHALFDPLGFAFEGYDATGRHRTSEAGQRIDTSGEVIGTDDMNGPFQGPQELLERLASSSQVRDCMATQWFRYALRRLETEEDACSQRRVRGAFAVDGNLRTLIEAVVQSDGFLYKKQGGML